MTRVTREPRRLETGDWVRVRGDDPSIRGVGKIIDGDFAVEDDALTACEIEIGARRVWISPADLTRITPDEEARLCDVALARGLVPAERRARLDDALREFRAGKRAVIRTPGLVDLLWATSTLADPTHGSDAVTAFLVEEALTALPTPVAPMSTPAPEPREAAPEPREPAPDRGRPLDRQLPPGEVLMRAFDVLSRGPLFELAARLGLAAVARENRVGLLRDALQALPPEETLRRVITLMTDLELQLLSLTLGFEKSGIWSSDAVRARIAAVAGLPPDDDAS